MLKRRWNAVVLYAVSGILVLFYIAVLVISMKPEVSWEYQLFYIDQTTEKFANNGAYRYEMDTVITATTDSADDLARFDKGWSHPESDGTWTDGDSAMIYFDQIPQKHLLCTLTLQEQVYCSSVTIFANDAEVGTFSDAQLAAGCITAEIPEAAISEGHLVLRLAIEAPTVPNERDHRQLGIKCRSIVLNEKGS